MLIAVSSFISVAVEIAQSVKYNFIIIPICVKCQQQFPHLGNLVKL